MKRIAGIFLIIALPLLAQFRAGVQGIISDSTGSVIPDATVTLTNTETQRTQKTQTSGDGFYNFSGLPPGTYTITAEKMGLRKQTLSDVQIGAEEIQGRNLTLSAGDVSQSVTVSDTATAALETENGDVGKSITAAEVEGLPQVGRDPYELVRLTREYSAMEQGEVVGRRPTCPIRRARAARITPSFRPRTRCRWRPMVSAFRRTIFRSTASA